jgi:hypothetical protein
VMEQSRFGLTCGQRRNTSADFVPRVEAVSLWKDGEFSQFLPPGIDRLPPSGGQLAYNVTAGLFLYVCGIKRVKRV